MRFPKSALVSLILISASVHATPEVIGSVHPVIEPDMVEWMKQRAATYFTPEKIDQLKHERNKATRQYAEHPAGLGLPRTKEAVTRWYDPSMTVPYDLRDHEGQLIHAAGTTVNPLDWRPLTQQMVFFDGNDKDQVRWAEEVALRSPWRVKPILVDGAPLELGRKWNRLVYFDQKGLLVTKLGIQQVPAIVRQDGMRLRIDEVLP